MSLHIDVEGPPHFVGDLAERLLAALIDVDDLEIEIGDEHIGPQAFEGRRGRLQPLTRGWFAGHGCGSGFAFLAHGCWLASSGENQGELFVKLWSSRALERTR